MVNHEEKELINLILGKTENPQRKSTLQLALSTARFHIGIENGGDIQNVQFGFRHNLADTAPLGIITQASDEAELFAAMLTYFISLEQIGNIFCKDNENDNGIIRAILEFGGVQILSPYFTDQDASEALKAIKCLRHAFAHSYGLINVHPKDKTKRQKFLISNKDRQDGVVLELPILNWSGKFEDKSIETSYTIYAFPFFRMVERIIKELESRNERDELHLVLPLDEVRARYTILTP